TVCPPAGARPRKRLQPSSRFLCRGLCAVGCTLWCLLPIALDKTPASKRDGNLTIGRANPNALVVLVYRLSPFAPLLMPIPYRRSRSAMHLTAWNDPIVNQARKFGIARVRSLWALAAMGVNGHIV